MMNLCIAHRNLRVRMLHHLLCRKSKGFSPQELEVSINPAIATSDTANTHLGNNSETILSVTNNTKQRSMASYTLKEKIMPLMRSSWLLLINQIKSIPQYRKPSLLLIQALSGPDPKVFFIERYIDLNLVAI